MLKKSLVTKYLDECRYIAGNEQIHVEFSRKDVMVKYDADKVQAYFGDSTIDSPSGSMIISLLSDKKKITTGFLDSSLWLNK